MEYKNCIVFIMGFTGVGKYVVAKEIAKHPYFKMVDSTVIENPVTSLLDMEALNYRVPDAAWQQVGKVRDAVFTTIRDLSPPHFSFVITYDMVEGDEFPKILFDMVQKLASERQAFLLPVRLECSEAELVKRISSDARKVLVDRAINMAKNKKVFYSNHPNEITINSTNLSPTEAAKLILDSLKDGNNG